MSLRGSDILRDAVAQLTPVIGADCAPREARMLLALATGWSPARLSTSLLDDLTGQQAAEFAALVARRLTREPVAQILGHWPFYGRDFAVSRDVLTPRPDTETLVDLALTRDFDTLLDLGTGSGILAITLLAERPKCRALATDLSAAALDVAADNARTHGVADRLGLLRADWFTGIDGTFDLIVSNPPYVSAAAYDTLAPEITLFEPRQALTPEGDGLAPYRVLSVGARARLTPGGMLMTEIGFDQAASVSALFFDAGLEDVTVTPDINGHARVVSGRNPGRI